MDKKELKKIFKQKSSPYTSITGNSHNVLFESEFVVVVDQLINSAVEEELKFLYKEYAEEDDSKLHESAKPIKKNLLKLVDSKWISVEDELPESEIPKDYRVAWIVFDGDIVTYTTQHPLNWNKDGRKITHWQPLPQPPKEE